MSFVFDANRVCECVVFGYYNRNIAAKFFIKTNCFEFTPYNRFNHLKHLIRMKLNSISEKRVEVKISINEIVVKVVINVNH